MDSHDYSNSGVNSEASPALGCTPSEAQASKIKGKNKASSDRKNMKWGRYKHTVFISCYAEAIVAGHCEGKCFTSAGWELIIRWLTEHIGQEWTQPALLSHWKTMHKDHTLFLELFNCSSVTYDHNMNAIVTPDHWWE